MKKLIALFLVITFIVMNCVPYEKGKGINLEPGQKPGAKLVIQKTDGQQVRGELIAVKQNSLVLMERDSGADVTVDVDNVNVITIVKKWWAKKGFKSGSKVGAGLGVGVVLLTAALGELEGGNSVLNVSFPVLGFGLFLGLIGGLWGARKGIDEIIQIEGKSDSEIQAELEKLRKKARVPDYQ